MKPIKGGHYDEVIIVFTDSVAYYTFIRGRKTIMLDTSGTYAYDPEVTIQIHNRKETIALDLRWEGDDKRPITNEEIFTDKLTIREEIK